jgi:hypothetical protein
MGHGLACLAVSRGGTVSFKGTLGDGSAAMAKVPLAANGKWPLYISLYSGQGSILGWLTIQDTATNGVTGQLLWTKPAGTGGPIDAKGFTNVLRSLGSRYVPPAAGERVVDLTTATVLLDGGNLADSLTNVVALDQNNRVIVTSPNTNQLGLVVSCSAGTFRGSFVHPQTGKPSLIKGAFLQKQNFGCGFFPGTNQSGSLALIPLP